MKASIALSPSAIKSHYIMRAHTTLVHLSIGVEVVRFVWVRAYKRYRNGKLEKVRAHYRRM